MKIADRLWPLAALAERAGVALAGPALADLFADWPGQFAALQKLAAKAEAAGDLALPAAGANVLAPLLYPGKILCAGANYYDHIKEMGVADTRKEAQRLFFFFKPPRNAVVGPGRTVKMPPDTKAFDWEVELVAVFGRAARLVREADALSHVAAYTVGIDFSARDLNRAPETFYKLDWVAGKAHDTCGPMGPWLVPAAFIPDPQKLKLSLTVNGVTKQDAETSGMIFSLAEQIATASRIMTLDPGDALFTGTPAGVGAARKEFLKIGDRVEASVAGIGTLAVEIGA
jgi:2-keto-4-pentenoate hydratase/2-oxohepta-3-ene-1,7-dioic acid hydratase in catechol pathway